MKTQHDTQVSFRITEEARAILEAIKERDGIPLSEQLRRALGLWIASKRKDGKLPTKAGRP